MEALKQRILEHIADLLDEPTFDMDMRLKGLKDPLPSDKSELHLLMTDAAFKALCTYFSKEDETKQCTINGVGGSYIIKIYDQDLCSGWIDKGGYSTPQKHINGKELLEDLKENGLEVIKFAFSSFGACYFIEVKGDYKGSIEFYKLETKAKDIEELHRSYR